MAQLFLWYGVFRKKEENMRKLWRQGLRFIGISGIGWIIDFAIFNLLNVLSDYVTINNVISSLVAVCFVFGVSTRKTFKQKDGGISIKEKFAVYILYQIVLILVISQVLGGINRALVEVLDESVLSSISAMISKIIITPITMITNFFVMKLLIERI